MKASSQLRKFRKTCEKHTGKDAFEMDVSVAALLIGICHALGIRGRSRKRVVGRKSYHRLENLRNCRVTLIEPPSRSNK
jgi:hypothetical protein